jgi:CHASE2 domain-containing sensor protein
LVEDRRGNRTVPSRKVPLLTVISASALPDTKEIPGPGGALDGSIVAIGGSYSDAHDLHATPVGQMPGALVLLNAINTVLQFPEGSLRPAPWWLEWLIEICVIVIVALIFEIPRLPIVFATLLSLFIGSIIILLVACQWIESGISVGIAGPIIGIIVHRWREDLYDAWQEFWERRHG